MAAERALYYHSRKRKQRLVCFILQAAASCCKTCDASVRWWILAPIIAFDCSPLERLLRRRITAVYVCQLDSRRTCVQKSLFLALQFGVIKQLVRAPSATQLNTALVTIVRFELGHTDTGNKARDFLPKRDACHSWCLRGHGSLAGHTASRTD